MPNLTDYAEFLRQQAQSSVAALHQFRLLFSPTDGAIHLFFEGTEDGPYYLPEFRRIAGEKKVRPYNCGGKANVVLVRTTIHDEGYPTDQCLFFVDRDFDDLLQCQIAVDARTYLTDFYSIENDLISSQTVEILLTDVVGISPADPNFDYVIASVADGLSAFEKKFCVLMAWCLATREAGTGLNLSNANLGKMFAVNGSGTISTKVNWIPNFKKWTLKSGVGADFRSVLKWRKILKGMNSKYWFRGKYHMWCFETLLLNALGEVVVRQKAAQTKPSKIPTALRERNLFELLGGRIPKPISLTTFFQSHFLAE